MELEPEACAFYRRSLSVISEAGVPFLVGGAYAFERYTGVARYTKDFDLFVRPRDAQPALDAFARAGYHTEMTSDVWLGKAYQGDLFVDFIFRSGNGVSEVGDTWFEHAVEGQVLGMSVKLCPPEELIWMKAFIMDRERYDGADVAHLIRACAADLDWPRLLREFGSHWRVLLSHLVLFGFIYPDETSPVPGDIMHQLLARLRTEVEAPNNPASPNAAQPTCRGTLLSRTQYLIDVDRWGYKDGRLTPDGNLTRDEVASLNKDVGTPKT
ncbi:MAG: nucleotidyltransferase [Chloroflexia bacterium]